MTEKYTEYGYRGLEELKEAKSQIEMLKKAISEETKEKYTLYQRIKELNEEIKHLRNDSNPISGPEYRQRYHT